MKVRPSISGTCGQAFQALIDVDSGWDADPRAIVAAAHRFDMASSKIETRSVDAGTSWAVLAADGQPLRSADARGFVLAHAYDALRRPTTLTVTPPTGPAFVAERLVYGDDPSVAPVDPTAYLVGRVYRQYDGAGILTYDRYDFKGNSIEQTRQLITTRSGAPDWSSPYLTPLKSRTEYDALNRPPIIIDWQDVDIGTGKGTKTGTDEINLPKGEPANDNAVPGEGEGVKEAARTAVKTGATIGAGYVAYRVIRFIPSLFPPLWWTIPENAVIP